MKNILLILLFLTSLSTYAQYTTIPDVNFEKALITLGLDSGSPDGKVLTSKISSQLSLNVSSKFIADFTGIQDFTALKSLYCDSNYLTSLDITKNFSLTNLQCSNNRLINLNVSNNIVLTTLNCSYNQLNALDVSNNIALTTLNCSYNQLNALDIYSNIILDVLTCNDNLLNNLDVSKNGNLRNFYCSKNRLTTLDVSKSVFLEVLDCSYNQINAVDVSNNIVLYGLICNNNKLINLNLKNGKNTNLINSFSNFKGNPDLSCIQVDNVTYSISKWQDLKDLTASYFGGDCMAYTLIPDIEFEKRLNSLKIDKDGINGKVYTFDVKKIKVLNINNISSNYIKDLTGIEDFILLNNLSCDNNLLETLDLSKNIELVQLNCTRNKLINLNVSSNVALTQLDCYDNKLVNLDVSKNLAIKYLYCNKNQLVSLDVAKNIDLYYLWCDFNQLNSLDVSKNLSLKYLYCNFNLLNSLDVSKNLELTDLRFAGNKLTSFDVSKNLILGILDFEGNQVTNLDVSKNLALSGLHCYGNQLTSIDVSKNIGLTDFRCNANKLLNLNLKNGKNTNLNDSYLDFKGNPNLTCIQVDNETYSNINWATKKDATATYSAICTLGIEDSVFDKIVIYPNPTMGQLHIDNIILEKTTVYNTNGELVRTELFTKGLSDNSINLSDLSKGIYYIYLQSANTNATKKIIVE